MNTATYFLSLVLYYLASLTGNPGTSRFQHCAAAFLGSGMIVNEYTPSGKCSVTMKATGDLSVQTVDLGRAGAKAVEPIAFRIAIRDKDTKTLLSFSGEAMKKIAIEKVLARCKKGDAIILLTTDETYALPHNEIQVQ
ncbi:hypothetical protein [Arsenicibacter rosenii]|uniref:Gliding motility-associated protein GldM C-terminal domain-containing protein n=1 Tax=Arsenicibacter rosenii TaxID=1750698 RepID=A0A1S2VFE7_9BACT|nr:hypothetical protein [Arsenicibacter rosenii]OIN57444.1 hypothetical protein BLX24_19635 [Arsenicibacter rosenii]